MIISFGDRETELIFQQIQSRKLPIEIQSRALVKLILLHVAANLEDLRVPPSNRLERLKGNLKEFYSIRINDQWRIIFQFQNGDASNVSIVDYH